MVFPPIIPMSIFALMKIQVRLFAKAIIRVFGPEYLRSPNEEDTKKLMAMNEARGWPGMLESIDCMH
jgi:hypothetical protein